MHVKFEEPTAGNSFKNSRLRGVVKECVPNKAILQRFSHKKENSCHSGKKAVSRNISPCNKDSQKMM